MPQVNPATVVLLLLALLGGAWAAGLLRPSYDGGRLTIGVLRANRVLLTIDFRDTWLLLGFTLLMGWAVAIAVERSEWVPDTAGRLVPALTIATGLGWIFAIARASRLAYAAMSGLAVFFSLALLTPSPLTSGGTLPAIRAWLLALPNRTNTLLLLSMLLMFVATGLWTSWWVFARRNGLVALLPSGTILAVEIINDQSPGLTLFTLIWLTAAAAVLLRLNFVALKEGWRVRRLPRAADTGWTFGEVGIEATAGILILAFLLIPPLSSTDISAALIPGAMNPDGIHPFGIGSSNSQPRTVGSIGYSEVVRPGSQLKAKSQTVMVVTGDTPVFYPYWRGIALAGWDGITWYELPSSAQIPVRQQPLVAARAGVPRDDLPAESQRIQVLHNSFHVVVPPEQTLSTVFSAGEILSVDNQPISVRGIMTSLPAPPGSNPSLVNIAGDNGATASFDTVDRVRFAKRLQPPYNYSVSEAIPNVDVQDLRSAGTDYPAWLAPYASLYDGRVASGYSTARDPEIAALARSIVGAAGATTPYDQAKALESWFLAKGRFTYTLKPPPARAGERPLDFFLFTSRKGFCQDFSTALNVMLRTLGIPSRQMSGFGEGVFDEKTHQYTVNSLDAHSWVEVFFPGYGWIPFEATPDGLNAPVNRPLTKDALNAPESASAQPSARIPPGLREPSDTSGTFNATAPFADIWRPLLTVGVGLLLLALIAFLLALRWLMTVRDVPRIWRRLLFLGDRLKVPRRSGDTPQEFGGRLAASMPAHDAEVRRLATLYTRASFRRGGLNPAELAEARKVWAKIRGSYAGLVARAWRDALRQGRVVSAEEAVGSESHAPLRPH